MTREKIMAFLNIDNDTEIDKSAMKIFAWFNVSFSLAIILAEWLLDILNFSPLNVVFLIFSFITSLLSFISIRWVKRSVQEWFHHIIVSFCSTLILLFGWYYLSIGELIEDGYPRTTWVHIIVLIITLVLAVYMAAKMFWVFHLLETHTVEQARAKINKRMPVWLPFVSSLPPMILVRALRDPMESMGLGCGFAMWLLMCIWILFTISIFPKVFIILKYKVHKW